MSQSLTDYSLLSPRGASGQVASSIYHTDRLSLLNSRPERQTVAPLTVGGTIGTETFTITYTLQIGDSTQTVTISYTAASGDTANIVAQELAQRSNLNPVFFQYAQAIANGADVEITVRQERVNLFTAIAGTATGSATITASPTITPFAEAANIPFGYVVGQTANSSPSECQLWSGTGEILGIAEIQFSEQMYPQVPSSTQQRTPPDFYRSGDVVQVIRRGQVWVATIGTPTVNAVAYANNTTGQVQTMATGGTLIPNAVFRTNYSDGVNILEVR